MRKTGGHRWLHLLLCLTALLIMCLTDIACAEVPDYSEYAAKQPACSDGLFVLDETTAVLTGDAVLSDAGICIDETGSITYSFSVEKNCSCQLEITCRPY